MPNIITTNSIQTLPQNFSVNPAPTNQLNRVFSYPLVSNLAIPLPLTFFTIEFVIENLAVTIGACANTRTFLILALTDVAPTVASDGITYSYSTNINNFLRKLSPPFTNANLLGGRFVYTNFGNGLILTNTSTLSLWLFNAEGGAVNIGGAMTPNLSYTYIPL